MLCLYCSFITEILLKLFLTAGILTKNKIVFKIVPFTDRKKSEMWFIKFVICGILEK